MRSVMVRRITQEPDHPICLTKGPAAIGACHAIGILPNGPARDIDAPDCPLSAADPSNAASISHFRASTTAQPPAGIPLAFAHGPKGDGE
jgi:hypothetical protein